ncbi:ferric-dicitrate binding protein FerR (iron transport regulator) [Algoriphagus sp. 4150]|uniref:FecR family protein n=1 Tax=Algoriphagus sp. 4150 TaxID=2817756 RepID=UPI0028612E45|nr:FecR domain-containing protein [Algoriphagus sp. 4150]MDR7131311.1 ferric-dicitrate binding protein FerR (iron transport regulator) [Algoriphagus sp. 4150]
MTKDNFNLYQDGNEEPLPEFVEAGNSDFVDQLKMEEQQALKKKIFKGIKSGIRQHEEKLKSKKRILHRAKIAASIVLLVAANIGLWQTLKSKTQTYQTGANETLEIKLPDGSIVLMNSNSSLTYSYTWALGFDRKVELTGEAYFDIAKDTNSKRFVINEGEMMEVEVYGTEFNFKNQHPVHKLTLIEGSVKLGYQSEEGNTSRMVVPGETIKLNVENHQIETKKVADPIRLLAWQNRKLRMQNESLEDVLSIVTELYDIEFQVQKIPPTTQLISGSLPLTDNPNEVIENIQVLFDTKITLEQNSLRIQ